MRLLAFACLLCALGACSNATTTTHRIATLSYARTPTVVFARHGDHDLIEPWRRALVESHRFEVIGTLDAPAASTGRDRETAAICERAAQTPSDLIADVYADIVLNPHQKCVDWSCPPTHEQPLFHDGGDGATGSCTCRRYEYTGSSGHVESEVRLVDSGTCRILTRGAFKTPEYNGADTVDPIADGKAVRSQLSIDTEHIRLHELPTLELPSGPRLLALHARDLIVDNRGLHMRPGDQLWLQRRDEPDTKRRRVHVATADDQTATLAADKDLGTVVPGDELHAIHYVYRATGYGAIAGGTTTSDAGRSGMAAATVAVRWSFDRYPLMAELLATGDYAPGISTRRFGSGGAAGLRWPIGPFDPVAFVEGGITKAWQDLGGARATAGYAGVGVGVELWISKVFVFADIRRRYYLYDAWKLANGTPALVENPDLDVQTTTLQLAVGRRY